MVAALAAGTPRTRDRYVDLLRAASIIVVVCGHWLMATVIWTGDQGIRTGNLLTVVSSLRPATWVLQVMPVFFFVGGYANRRSWASARGRGDGYAGWIEHRLNRLLRPLAPFVLGWLAVATLLGLLGLHTSAVRSGLLVAVQPLWFVALYVLVVALTPLTAAAHDRWGVPVPVALVAAVGLVDVVRLAADVGRIGDLNYAFVWVFAHQLGYFYADGRLQRVPRRWLGLAAAAGLAALVTLTTAGPYPVSLVGLPGDQVSNMAPPSAVVVALTVWLVALVLLLRPVAVRWLSRPRVWASVVAVNTVVLTVFLWHLTALVIVVALASAAHLPQPAVASIGWWWERPLWFALLAAVLAALVRLAARWERPAAGAVVAASASPPHRRPLATPVIAAVGAAYVVLGLAGLARTGLDRPFGTRHATVLYLATSPLLAVLLLAVGAAFVTSAASRRRAETVLAAAAVLAGVAALGLAGAAASARLGPVGPVDAVTHLGAAAVAVLAAARQTIGRAGPARAPRRTPPDA